MVEKISKNLQQMNNRFKIKKIDASEKFYNKFGKNMATVDTYIDSKKIMEKLNPLTNAGLPS
jgi:hypothetical protein